MQLDATGLFLYFLISINQMKKLKINKSFIKKKEERRNQKFQFKIKKERKKKLRGGL